MLKHAGEWTRQQRQGFVQPVVCSLSRRSLTSCKNSFYAPFTSRENGLFSSFCSKKRHKKKEKKRYRETQPPCCAVHPHFFTKEIVLQRLFLDYFLAENNCSAPKRKAEDATHLLLIIYPRCEVSSCCIWLHANVHWLVLVTLKADWPL